VAAASSGGDSAFCRLLKDNYDGPDTSAVGSTVVVAGASEQGDFAPSSELLDVLTKSGPRADHLVHSSPADIKPALTVIDNSINAVIRGDYTTDFGDPMQANSDVDTWELLHCSIS
jgi:hypothetical protein